MTKQKVKDKGGKNPQDNKKTLKREKDYKVTNHSKPRNVRSDGSYDIDSEAFYSIKHLTKIMKTNRNSHRDKEKTSLCE